MNSPAMLIGSGGAPLAAAPVAATEPAPENGFSSALASSIAGLVKLVESATEEAVQPQTDGADAPAPAPAPADVAQWLGLPVAAAAPVETDFPAEPADAPPAGIELELMPQDEVIAAVAVRLTAQRSGTAETDSTASTPPADGDEVDLLLPDPVPAGLVQASAAAAGATTVAQPVAQSSAQALLTSPLMTNLSNALVRDGVTNAPGNAPSVRASLHETVGSARWADELGSRLVMMSVRGQQEGSLTLMPEHLGPLEVQISVNKDTANVWFGAQHADTRAALTEALPRLRELLAASGLSLGQSGVSEQAPRRSSPDGDSTRPGSGTMLDPGVVDAPAPVWRSMRAGLIDTYA